MRSKEQASSDQFILQGLSVDQKLNYACYKNYCLQYYLQMSNIAERVVVLTLAKIFNWGDSQSSDQFEISISSLKTSSLILFKPIKGVFTQNQVIFNYSLRVLYHADENQILIKLSHLSKMSNTMNAIAEFVINLDNLLAKKMQFFPFGKNDKVFKITIGEQENRKLPNNSRFNLRNQQQFIRQKEQFLMKITNTTSNSRIIDNSRQKKCFSEQAKSLLSQVKVMKQEKPNERSDNQQQFRDYYQEDYDTNKKPNHNLKQNKVINKSNSERNLMGPKTTRYQISKRSSREQEYQRKSNRSQKHKLALKSLEMVACQNQYYEQSQYSEDRAGSMNTQAKTKAPAMKRLIKSQLY